MSPKIHRFLIYGWIIPITLFLLHSTTVFAQPPKESLIIFTRNTGSSVSKHFQSTDLPRIKALATEMGIGITVVDTEKGAPKPITLTPMIVYQNHLGRSIYQGHTNTTGRIRNFIRTSRFVAQGDTPLKRQQTFVAQKGRMRLWAPIKISQVTGTPPKNYHHETFVKEAFSAFKKGFSLFRFKDEVNLGRGDRGFYMDFYPWRSKDGTLYLSLALYSQFHCKEPVFEMKKPPLIGPYKKRKALFKQAARIMEEAVLKIISDPEGGDGFDPLGNQLKALSYEALGLSLPAPPLKKTYVAANKVLPKMWTLAKPSAYDPPIIQFRFPPPLDNYQGEAKTASGKLSQEKSGLLTGSKGFVTVNTKNAVTMGEPVLDEAIKGSLLLGAQNHPEARFDLEAIYSDNFPLAYGELKPVTLTGQFMLKGKVRPMSLIGEVEPIVDDNGEPRLLIRCGFKIDLREYDIEGAEGPEPQRHMLLFDVNLNWKKAP